MEKEKRPPKKHEKRSIWKTILYILLALLSVPMICTALCGIWGIAYMIPIYNRVSSVQDWDVPPETEVIDFDTSGFNPYRWCDPICRYGGRLTIVSNLSINELKNFYQQQQRESDIEYITVRFSDSLYDDDRPIYIVNAVVTD